METQDPPLVTTAARPGAVTFLPPAAPRDRMLVPLLAAVVALQVLLIAGLAAAGWVAYTQYRELRAAAEREAKDARAWLGDERRTLDGAAATTRALLADLSAGRRRAGTGFQARSAETLAQVDALARRRAALSGVPADPFGKLDRMIRLNQLLADEQLLLLRHTAGATAITGQAVQPRAAR